MNTAQGSVKAITSRQAGKGMAYNFCLEDGVWYGNGWDEPTFSKGDFIKFTYTANGNFKNVDKGSVQVVQDERPTVHAAVSTGGRSATGTDWDMKDKRITFLACRKDAIALTQLGVECGALKLPAKDKFAALVGIATQTSEDLFQTIYGEVFPTHDVLPIVEEKNDIEE